MASLLKKVFTSNAETMKDKLDRAILQGAALTIPVSGLEAGMMARARTTPHRYGIIAEIAKLNFAEIACCTDRLAHILQVYHGVGPGVVVGLFLPRNQWVPVAMAAILKAGGAFVAFDPAAPEERLTYMLRDSGAKLLLVTTATKSRLPKSLPTIADIATLAQQPVGEVSLETHADPKDPAYIVYTSGSTGFPKGVLIERHAVTNLIYALEQILYVPLGGQVRELLSAPFIFDAAIQQCLSCLVTGNELHILNESSRRDPVQFLRYVREHNIQIINVVTPFLLALLDHGLAEAPPPSLKHIVTGGEAVPPALIERLYACETSRHLTLTNMYGPAENCTDSTYFPITAEFTPVGGKIPIGHPLPNTRVYVLDSEQKLVEPGVVGEIYVAGAGVAQGYVNQPELTATHFIHDPFYPSERAYRTGDLGLITSEGLLLFVGRCDEQIKIRGYRVELREVSAVLLTLEGVKEAAIIVQQNELDTALIAFVATSVGMDEDALRIALAVRLPDYMIPNQIRILDRLPHNLNGKIDFKALEIMALEEQSSTDEVAATNNIECIILAIWQEVLGSHVKGITDNFFFLGGHSLKAAQITGRIQERLSVELAIGDIYRQPCVQALAALIHEHQIKPLKLIPQVEEQPYYPLSHAQQRLWLLCQMEGGSLAYNVPLVWDVPSVDLTALGDALTLVVRRHEALRTGFITVDGAPKQFVLAPEDIRILPVVHDLTAVSDANIQAEAITNRETNTTFQLEVPPLLRLVVLQLPGDRWRLLLTIHHLVVDGWSLMVLFDEINHTYDELRVGSPPTLPSVLLRYQDYVLWHTQQNFELAITYWLKQLADVPPELALPIDPEDCIGQFCGSSVQRQIDPSLVQRLEHLAQERGITLASLLLSLFLLLLFKFTKQVDICVGMGAAGRTHPQLERLVGLMVNILPIRVQITDSMTFAELTDRVAQTIAEALNHQEVPLDEVIRHLNPPRRPGRQPLFNVLFAFQSFEEEVLTTHKASLLDPSRLERLFFGTAKFDLTLFVNRRDDGLLLSLEYNSSCLRAQTCQRLLKMLEQLARHVVGQEEQR
jgi:amino acid adenylation domain-containing protein